MKDDLRGVHEADQATASDVECSLSQRVDGKLHSWKWDGDDPRIICVYCGEMRDALSGDIYRKGRKA